MRQLFNTVYGRNLVAEVPAVVFRPYVVITMKDLWPKFEEALTGPYLVDVHFVDSLEIKDLDALADRLAADAVIGLGGGWPSTWRSTSPGDVTYPYSRSQPLCRSTRLSLTGLRFGTRVSCATSAGRYPRSSGSTTTSSSRRRSS